MPPLIISENFLNLSENASLLSSEKLLHWARRRIYRKKENKKELNEEKIDKIAKKILKLLNLNLVKNKNIQEEIVEYIKKINNLTNENDNNYLDLEFKNINDLFPNSLYIENFFHWPHASKYAYPIPPFNLVLKQQTIPLYGLILFCPFFGIRLPGLIARTIPNFSQNFFQKFFNFHRFPKNNLHVPSISYLHTSINQRRRSSSVQVEDSVTESIPDVPPSYQEAVATGLFTTATS
ncbi:13302_t:CDS:2, partial [Dentiscutata erythropus]